MRKFLFFSLFLSTISGFAQQTVDVGKQDVRVSSNMFYSVAGSPVSTTKYVKLVSGSPYFSNEWMFGRVELADGSKYENVKLKLDLTDNSLLYLDRDSNEMIATASIKNVTLVDEFAGKEYDFTFSAFIKAANVETGWYQVLADGPTVMYKRIAKKIDENKPYGSATIEQTITSINKYFVFANSTLSNVKKFRELPDILTDRKDDLNKYISSMKLTGKSDADYADLVTYYNQITTK